MALRLEGWIKLIQVRVRWQAVSEHGNEPFGSIKGMGIS
jgi:hypothetical protein